MKKFSLFLFGGVLLTIVSCKNNIIQKEKDLTNESPIFRAAGDGNYDLLGYGYDATQEFANANSSKAKVIDINKILRLNPSRIESSIIGQQDGVVVSGADSKSYAKTLSAKVDATAKYMLFKGSISAAFSSEDFSSSKYSYASYDLEVQRRRLTLNVDEDELYNYYLTSDFVFDCKRLSAKELVDRYGTHVLRNIKLGGKLSVMFRCETTAENKKEAVEAGLSASVGSIFKLNVSVSSSSTQTNANKNSKLHYRTIGGDPTHSLIGTINTDGNSPVINTAPWQSSVTLQNAQLISIEKDGLIPLYKLIPDSKKRNEVKDYIYRSIYKLRKDKDYMLNGEVCTFKHFFYSTQQTYLQINDSLISVKQLLTFIPSLDEHSFLIQGAIKGSRLINLKYDLNSPTPMLLNATKSDIVYIPELLQDIHTRKYYIRLSPNSNIIHPIHSDKTFEVYNISMEDIKMINAHSYKFQIGNTFI